MDNQNTAAPQPENNVPPANNTSNSSDGKLMGVLSYLGPLVLIPLLMGNQSTSVKFHVKQGLVLLTIEVIVWVLGYVYWPIWMILRLINLITFVLSIVGIINVVKGKEKELPIVGSWSRYYNIK